MSYVSFLKSGINHLYHVAPASDGVGYIVLTMKNGCKGFLTGADKTSERVFATKEAAEQWIINYALKLDSLHVITDLKIL